MARKSTGKRLRFEVFKRDRFECQYCGAHPPEAVLVCDHITPVALGGTNDIDNLTTACEPCNQGKAAIPLGAIPESLASKAERIAEAEEQLRGFQDVLAAREERLVEEAWRVAHTLWPNCTDAATSDFLSIKKFVRRLGVYQCVEFAEISYTRARTDYQRFKYFCGCCWRLIKGGDHAEG